jgi:hypothetical protein
MKFFKKNRVILKSMILLTVTLLLISPVQAFYSQQNQPYNKKSYAQNDSKAWTALYYIDVEFESYNADVLEIKFIDEIASGENLNVIVLQDKEDDPAFIYHIDENHNKTLLEELGEVNMADPQTLINFISYGKENYPAERYQLCIWSHANAWYGTCPDETSGGDIMTSDEFKQALIISGGVDLLCFIGCCQMGSLEAVYELKDLCEVYIGSEDDGYGPHWYGMLDDMCELLDKNTSFSTIECGKQIIQFIVNNPNEFAELLTISAIEMDKITGLVGEIEELSIHLYKNYDDLYDNFKSARALTKEYDFIQDSYLIDIYDLADNYLEIETNQTICQILSNIKIKLSETVIAEYHGEIQSGSHGLSIFYSTSDLISLYKNYGLDFTRDTHWDELLYNHKVKSKTFFINDLFKQFLNNHPLIYQLFQQFLKL